MRVGKNTEANGTTAAGTNDAKSADSIFPKTLVFVGDGSAKFYTVDVKKNVVQFKFGKIGSAGTPQFIPAADAKAAIAIANAKIAEKERDGYVSHAGGKTAKTNSTNDAPVADTVERVANARRSMITEMSWSDVEAAIEKHYGHEYEMVAYEEWSNDSQHRFDVTGEVEDPEAVERFKNGKAKNYLLDNLLNDMAASGAFPKGKVLITVCW